MIVAIHGAPGLSFAELTFMMTELGIGFIAAATAKPHKVGNPSSEHVVPVVFSSAKVFAECHSKIKFRAVAIVCDTYVKLKKELNWPLIGVQELPKDKHEYVQFDRVELGHLLQEADKLTQPTAVNLEVKIYDPTTALIEKFSESALSKSQTMVYKVKNQEHRALIFGAVKGWFTGLIKSRDSLYTKLKNSHDSDKYIESLMAVLTSKDGQTLRKVVIKSKAKPEQLESFCRKDHISPFDVRYLLSSGKKK